jgi:hypothetical protein
MKSSTRLNPLSFAILLLAAPLVAPADAPSQPALEAATTAIAHGAFGKVEAQTTDVPLTITVNGTPAEQLGAVFLVEPGDEVRLRAELPAIPSTSPAAPPDGRLSPGTFRQTRYQEIIWQGEADDIINPGPDGSVLWSPGTIKGKVSYVTASLAALEVERAATAEYPVKAPLRSGKAGVVLVAGVPFDRNGDGLLYGQNIGIYPNERGASAPDLVKENAARYTPPATFFKLDDRTSAARLTPRFTLGELAPPVFPEAAAAGQARYVTVSPRLTRFLTAFEEKLTAAGLKPANLVVLRGFVSPVERQRLDQRGVRLAEFTRFQYGDAVALVYTDPAKAENGPYMADVDANGTIGQEDVEKLSGLARDVMEELKIYGGVGVVAKYEGPGPGTASPYLHVDLRGWLAPFKEGY